MEKTKRNLLIGLAGIAILLTSVLVYSQVNAAYNYAPFNVSTGHPAAAEKQ